MAGYRKNLGNIYNNIRQGKTNEYKKPKTLTEAYLLQIINDEDGSVVYKSEVAPDKMDKIQKDLERSQKINIGDSQYTVYEIIDKCLDIDGWKQGNKNYKNQVFEPIKRIIHEVDINREKFGNLVELQTDPDNPFNNILLANPGTVYNYLNLISPKVFELFSTKEETIKVVNTIWSLDTKVSGISVGTGEIVMSLFSNARKGEAGDLDVPGIGEVEIKGSGARVGGDGFCHINTAPQLNDILQTRKIKINDFQLQQIKQDVINAINNTIGSRATDERKEFVAQLQGLLDDISTESSIQDIIKTVTSTKILPGSAKSPIVNGLKRYIKQLTGTVGGVFKGAIETFFRSEWNLTKSELIEGFIACRSYSNTDVKGLELGAVKLINDVNLLDEFSNRSNLARALAALHLVCYQRHEGFPYIVLANDISKNIVSLEFPESETTDETLVRVYNLLTELNVTVNLSVDKMFKSAGLTID